MASPRLSASLAVVLFGLTARLFAQQAVAPPDQFSPNPPAPQFPAVTPDGMALAQNNPAIDQARLREESVPLVPVNVDANGMALSETDSSVSDDDSFGAQMVLKQEAERVRAFAVTGGISLVYTNNVALTRRGMRSDVFAIVDAGIGWSRHLRSNLDANVSFRASIFRYDRTPELNFENLGFGLGLFYVPENFWGIGTFARYDFTELLGSDSRQILMEHVLSVGLQKNIAFGRSHGLSLGTAAAFGFSDPSSAQREQLTAFVGYHLQLTRKLNADVLYRASVNFYPTADRSELNQILSWSLRYHFKDWMEFNASVTYGINRSDRAVFDYDVFTGGALAGVIVRF